MSSPLKYNKKYVIINLVVEMVGIYLITNKINNKKYVGQSKDIERRWKEHILKEKNTMIHNAIKKYGKENFDFKILELCSLEQLTEKERYYYKKYKPEYNAIYPEDNPMNYESIKEKQKEAVNTKEFREKQSMISKKNYTEETKKRLVKSSHTKAANEKRIKTQNSIEYKQKASQIHKKMWNNKDYRNKVLPLIIKTLKKNRNNPEVIEKISKASKEKWLDPNYRNHIINETAAKKRKKIKIYNEEEVIIFNSTLEASKWFENKGKNQTAARTMISGAINGKCKSVYGYKVELL